MDYLRLRHALGGFATGVCVITAPDPDHSDGHAVGMTANSFSSVSLEPPLVQWCLDLKAHRYSVYAGAPRFGINVLSGGQAHLSRRFARENAHIAPQEGLISAAHPLRLKDAATFLDCELFESRVVGDHLVIIGKVLDFVTESDRNSLLFFRGRYSETGVML
jgi:flavin reductase (DIM6/NTAB) family NADH-FMN oxidoreductase RutF